MTIHSSDSADIIAFGPFQLDPARRALMRDGNPVALSSRAFDILVLLVGERGRVVSKDEIMSRVWRGMIVEENNLAVQVSALRRALAEGPDSAPLITTVPGQGYRFVGHVVQPAPAVAPPVVRPQFSAPPPTVRQIWKTMVLAGLTAIVAVLLLRHHAAPPAALAPAPPPRLSIAVLPFRDLSDDRCCDYLADAISDDLTTDLSHIPGSVVIARESSDAFRGRAVPTSDIGHALNVRYLLEGSLRGVEERFSINAQLIEAATGAHLWAEHFEVPRDHLAEAQTMIDHRLASALGVTLVDIEGSASLRERAQDPDALDLFLRARSILDRSDTLENLTQAQHLLEQAVAKRPGFTEAQAELAWLLPRKVHSFAYATQPSDLAEAHRIVASLLNGTAPANPSAPGAALALAAEGALKANDGHCEEAEPIFRNALTIDADSIAARTGLVVCLANQGRFSDVVAGLQALFRIDPEGPRNKVRAQQMGVALVMLGQPADAIAWLERSFAGDPEPAPGADDLGRVEWGRLMMIGACEEAGEHARAVTLYQSYSLAWPHRTVWQLGSEFTRALAKSDGAPKLLAAWQRVGMPAFADEHADFGVADDGQIRGHRAIEPTPLTLHAELVLDTAGVRAALRGAQPPVLLDFGGGAAVPDGARLSEADPLSPTDMTRLAADLPAADGRPLTAIIMGRGPFDWSGVNAVRQLARAGVRNVAWYRGGEEAWAAAAVPAGAGASDRRPQ